MVCVYCSGPTKVTNSRPQKRRMQVWRRRHCQNCGALFTTNEAIDLSGSLVVRPVTPTGTPKATQSPLGGQTSQNPAVAPFSRDKLFVSILRAVGHREQPLEDANALTATIIGKLLHATSEAALEPSQIVELALQTLKNFDTAAAVQYAAYHKL
jgi:transcriptional repressor NrdR